MTHTRFWRRENRQSCDTCREVPAGPPCYDCTFGLQTPPPHYTSVQNPDQPLQHSSSLSPEGRPEFDVASLAQGVSRIGMAVALAINESHTGALQVPLNDALIRTRHWSDQAGSIGSHPALVRNTSAPLLQSLDSQINEPLPAEEETHPLLAALTTTSPSLEPTINSPGESPLPCQLLIPE